MTTNPPHTDTPLLRLRSPEDLLAAVPYLLGFHPVGSLVAVAVARPQGQVTFTARVDLPSPDECAPVAAQVAAVLARQPADASMLIAYGSRERAEPVLDAVERHLADLGVPVREVLRVEDGRYWSPRCRDSRCCPPEGRPFDTTSSPVAAQATLAGLVALPDRATLERTLAPAGAAATRSATERAESLVARWADQAGDPATLRRRLVDEGRTRVANALRRCGDGERLTDDEAAMLGLLLRLHPVRDEAWLLVDDQHRGAHLALWSDVVRRVDPGHAAAPACLLAFAAWQAGDGALAHIALDRALEADREYSMAHLLGEALAAGVPPVPWPPAGAVERHRLRDRLD